MRRLLPFLIPALLLGSPAVAQFTSAQLEASSVSTDRSPAGGVVGTTPITLVAANAGGRYFSVQNQSATAYCWIRVGVTANAGSPSKMLPPLSLYETPTSFHPNGFVSIVCSAASTPVQAEDW